MKIERILHSFFMYNTYNYFQNDLLVIYTKLTPLSVKKNRLILIVAVFSK